MNNTVCEPWATVEDVDALPGCNPPADDTVVTDALEVASDILYRLSGHQWPGVCTATVRPVPRPQARYGQWGPPDWTWDPSWGSCSCHARHIPGCAGYSAVQLGVYPILGVDTVMVDGAPLDSGAYRVDDDRWLMRLPDPSDTDDSKRSWPCCQRLDLPDTEDNTWSVTFRYGGAPPPSGVRAAAVFGCELAKAAAGQDCQLPERVTSVTREGLTMQITDPQEFLTDGKLGLYAVDVFLSAVNPKGQTRRARVINPDRWLRRVRPDTGSGS